MLHSKPLTATRRPDLLSLMHAETRVHHGKVSDSLAGKPVDEGCYSLAQDQFLLRAKEFSILYSKGEGITIDLRDDVARGAMELMMAGSVRAAIASINGLFPFHASALAIRDRVVAFTGPSGSGKSTIVAALNRGGVPIYCDDTLIIDPERDPPTCLPGHKRLKLWPDAVDLTGAEAMDLVSEQYRKFYCTVGGGDLADPLPLGAIVLLQEGEATQLERLAGGARIAAIMDDHYTAALHQAANGYDRAGRLALLAALARSVPVWRFTRPFSRDRFTATTDFLFDQLDRLITP